MAKPTNKVRVIVVAASGCCASELNAVATARPSPSAGPMLPRAIVRPAVTIEAIAMSVVLSMVSPVAPNHGSMICGGFNLRLAGACGRCDVNCSQNAEDIGLHHSGEQTERAHCDWKDEG